MLAPCVPLRCSQISRVRLSQEPRLGCHASTAAALAVGVHITLILYLRSGVITR